MAQALRRTERTVRSSLAVSKGLFRRDSELHRFLELVVFKAAADLRAERARTYLGLLWWVLEPLIFMAVIYVVFSVLMKRGGPEFVPKLLIGLVLWQWFKSAISHSAASVLHGKALMRDVKVSPLLFPLSTVLADTLKATCVLVLLVVALFLAGYQPGWALVQLPLVLLVEFLIIIGCALLVSAVVPFAPDLRFVIEPLLQALFFLSAVFYSVDEIAPELRELVLANPLARLIHDARAILIDSSGANMEVLAGWSLFGVSLAAMGTWLLRRLARFYSKLPL